RRIGIRSSGLELRARPVQQLAGALLIRDGARDDRVEALGPTKTGQGRRPGPETGETRSGPYLTTGQPERHIERVGRICVETHRLTELGLVPFRTEVTGHEDRGEDDGDGAGTLRYVDRLHCTEIPPQ